MQHIGTKHNHQPLMALLGRDHRHHQRPSIICQILKVNERTEFEEYAMINVTLEIL